MDAHYPFGVAGLPIAPTQPSEAFPSYPLRRMSNPPPHMLPRLPVSRPHSLYGQLSYAPPQITQENGFPPGEYHMSHQNIGPSMGYHPLQLYASPNQQNPITPGLLPSTSSVPPFSDAGPKLPSPFRPTPPTGLGQQMTSLPSLFMDPVWMNTAAQRNLSVLPPPNHVVGSQGKRGVLPSDLGQAAAAPPLSIALQRHPLLYGKNSDGKFPCPHCSKTYLHAKHLKRHMLRHTGDRPYMCILCNDTFSRSDILKRHFQKCSIRRGNPTGASHLSNSAAHLRKSQTGSHKSSVSNSDGSDLPSLKSSSGELKSVNILADAGSITASPTKYGDEQHILRNPISRRNSIKGKKYAIQDSSRGKAGAELPSSSINSIQKQFDQNPRSFSSHHSQAATSSNAPSQGLVSESYNFSYSNGVVPTSSIYTEMTRDPTILSHSNGFQQFSAPASNRDDLEWTGLFHPHPPQNFAWS